MGSAFSVKRVTLSILAVAQNLVERKNAQGSMGGDGFEPPALSV
jgi:hypothetical protein